MSTRADNEHLDIETLSAFVDGELNAVVAARVERHTAACDACRAELGRVRELVVSARSLPREIAPPADAWRAVRSRVAAESRGRARVSRWWHNGWLATAAAIVLIVGTMTLTTRFASRGKAAKAKAFVAVPASPALLAVDRNYLATIRELRSTLETQRDRLSPATVQTVERSLRVIDAAIAEARAALVADPANQALVDILASHYERQVDLLQRAAELSSSN